MHADIRGILKLLETLATGGSPRLWLTPFMTLTYTLPMIPDKFVKPIRNLTNGLLIGTIVDGFVLFLYNGDFMNPVFEAWAWSATAQKLVGSTLSITLQVLGIALIVTGLPYIGDVLIKHFTTDSR